MSLKYVLCSFKLLNTQSFDSAPLPKSGQKGWTSRNDSCYQVFYEK